MKKLRFNEDSVRAKVVVNVIAEYVSVGLLLFAIFNINQF